MFPRRCVVWLGLGLTACPQPDGSYSDDVDGLRAQVADLQAQLRVITELEEVTAPGDYADIHEALAAYRFVRFEGEGTLRILASSAVYTRPIVIDHPQGHAIQIVGDPATPGVQLEFRDCDGVIAQRGNHLGLLDDVLLRGTNGAERGVIATHNSSITFGEGVQIADFELIGIEASYNSSVHASEVNLQTGFETAGVLAEWNSVVDVTDALMDEIDGPALLVRHGSRARLDGAEVDSGATSIEVAHGSSAIGVSMKADAAEHAVWVHGGSAVELTHEGSIGGDELGSVTGGDTYEVVLVESSAAQLSGLSVQREETDDVGAGVRCALGSFCDLSGTTYAGAMPRVEVEVGSTVDLTDSEVSVLGGATVADSPDIFHAEMLP